MYVLGLHFGFSASAAVLHDGKLLAVASRGRLARVRRAIGLDLRTVEEALRLAGVGADKIDWVAVTSTQDIELISLDPGRLAVSLGAEPRHADPGAFHGLLGGDLGRLARGTGNGALDVLYGTEDPERFLVSRCLPEFRRRRRDELASCPGMDTFVTFRGWEEKRELGLAGLRGFDAGLTVAREDLRRGFHFPCSVTIGDQRKPGYLIHHHLAHAASVFHPLGRESAAVLTHDMGLDRPGRFDAGMIYLGRGGVLHPLVPHGLGVARLLEGVAIALGLGPIGAPEQLADLAGLGRPCFFDGRFVGSVADLTRRGIKDPLRAWLTHCVGLARQSGRDVGKLDALPADAPLKADIAASTRKVVEQTLLAAMDAVHEMLARSGLAQADLCLAGEVMAGFAAGDRSLRESRFERIHLPAWPDDSGLAVGGGLALYHGVLAHPVAGDAREQCPLFVGRPVADDGARHEVDEVLAGYRKSLKWSRPWSPAREAARDVGQGRVVGWMEGRAQASPDAHGPRVLLADPRSPEARARMNGLRGAPAWRRGLALVSAESADDWFLGCREDEGGCGPFAAQVLSRRLAGLSGPDNRVAVRTIVKSDGDIWLVLEEFEDLAEVPVLLAAPLSREDGALAESLDDGLALLAGGGMDVLHALGYRFERRK